jgi:hypothetical protein
MTIKELREAKLEAEKSITESLGVIIRDFKKKTGYTPHSMQVDMVDVTNFGEDARQYVVGRTEMFLKVF